MINVTKSFIIISFITVCSRILGFIRDVLIARLFGVSLLTDAFFIAFKLPNLLRHIFAEGAVRQVFLPILSEYKYDKNIKELQIFVSHVMGLLIVILIIIIGISLLIAPWIISIIAPGIDHTTEKFTVTVSIFRIMFPYILLISLTSLMGVILNVWNFFAIPACASIFLNISMICSVLCLEYLNFSFPIIGLAWSVIFGGILQCIYFLPFLKKINMLVMPNVIFLNDNNLYKMCRMLGPAILSVSGSQVLLMINIAIASFLKDGAISWMYYADRLIELPSGILGVALTTVLLPYLSRFAFTQNDQNYHWLMCWSIKLCFILSFPSAVMLGVLSEPLIITLFQYGKFSKFDVLMTQHSVIAYAIGLPAFVLVKILSSGFYSRRDVITPAHVMLVVMIFNQCVNLMCISTLKHVAFSFSISLGAWLNAGLLYWKFKKKYLLCLYQLNEWFSFFYRLFFSLLVMCIVCFGMLLLIIDWEQGSIIYRLFRIIGVLVVCSISYFIMLWILGMRLKDFRISNHNMC